MLSRLPSLLVVIALAVAGLIPSGWMPASAQDGKVLLVICTGHGPVETWVDLDSGEPHAPAEQMEDRSCPFAALGAVALLPGSLISLNLEPPLSDRWSREAFTHRTAGFHWRYDARGPPALS
ncbi:DUF2946 family protein [Leisingera sp. SS27]|uniref:DUF2946 family protein n=1 Tax=Leisingera sp. SS27 TaxID=2979462 RepID=UPI0018141038|nr:DUF2946 family protein [Leisingera sp. SS27]MDC0657839.1 DUF2946 family protein [Leisingera sp. SS27]NVK13129.1 DUF2946 family protein [Paracoccaceae bacterium]